MSEVQPRVNVTIKGDSNPPWVVFHAEDAMDAVQQMEEAERVGLYEKAAAAGAFLRSAVQLESGGVAEGSAERQSTKPDANAGPHPQTCTHGQRNYVKLAKCDAYFCPLEDKSAQCRPIFADHGEPPNSK